MPRVSNHEAAGPWSVISIYLEISSSSRSSVRGPHPPIATTTMSMATAIRPNTPLVPAVCRKKPMMKLANTVLMPAERVGEADRAGPYPGRKQLGLIVVERVGQHVVRQRDQHAEQDQQRHRGLERESARRTCRCSRRRRPPAICARILSAKLMASNGPNGVGDGDDEGIEQAAVQIDAGLLGDQRRHPGGEAVEAEGLEELEHHQHDRCGYDSGARQISRRRPRGSAFSTA